MAGPFDPTSHPGLADLGGRLRELAGDGPYQAGRDYLRKGLVKQAAVAGSTAYASVTGSTNYRVSVAFGDEIKVTCTCPAHRRSKFCKHVVALCTALLERPDDFTMVEAAPEVQAPRAKGRASGGGGGERRRATRAQPAELRAAGLETVDRLLIELADDGLLGLGPDKAALLAGVGELVRSLKLRRLGNLVLALQRAAGAATDAGRPTASPIATQAPVSRARQAAALEPHGFADLLIDFHLTRRATGAHLEGAVSLDPRLAEELLGKTWREEELEPVAGLELVEVGYTRASDGEFSIETSYLADPSDGSVYAERQISPLRMFSTPKPRHRLRLLVDEAGLYPGLGPRRIKLQRVRRGPLALADVERLLGRAVESVSDLRGQLVERLQEPFGPGEVAVLFRPAALVAQDGQGGAVDREGCFLALDWPDRWLDEVPRLLPETGGYALFGLLALADRGLQLRCLSLVGALHWARGPIYPNG